MSRHLTPTEVCEKLIGRAEQLAAICGQQDKAAYGWRHKSKWRDAGDLPSTRYQRQLLAHAAARQIPLTADHLVWGASEAEVDAILADMRAKAVAGVAAE